MELLFYIIIIALTFLFQLTKRVANKKEKAAELKSLQNRERQDGADDFEVESSVHSEGEQNKADGGLRDVFDKIDVFYEQSPDGQSVKTKTATDTTAKTLQKTEKILNTNVSAKPARFNVSTNRTDEVVEVASRFDELSAKPSGGQRFSYDDKFEKEMPPSLEGGRSSSSKQERNAFSMKKERSGVREVGNVDEVQRIAYGARRARPLNKTNLHHALRDKNQQRRAVLLAELLNSPVALRKNRNAQNG